MKKNKRKIQIVGKVLSVFILASVLFVSLVFFASANGFGSSEEEYDLFTSIYPAPIIKFRNNFNGSVSRAVTFSLEQTPYLKTQGDDVLSRKFYEFSETSVFVDSEHSSTYQLPTYSSYAFDYSTLFKTGVDSKESNDIIKSFTRIGYPGELKNSSDEYLPGIYSYYHTGPIELEISLPHSFIYKTGTNIPYFNFYPGIPFKEEWDTLSYELRGKLTTVYEVVQNKEVVQYTYERDININPSVSNGTNINSFSVRDVHSSNFDYIRILSSTLNLTYEPAVYDYESDGFVILNPNDYYSMYFRFVNWYTDADFANDSVSGLPLSIQDVYHKKHMDFLMSTSGLSFEVIKEVVKEVPVEVIKEVTKWHNVSDLTSWLGDAVGGFFDIEIIPGFKLGAIMGIILSITITTMLLRLFAG